MQITGMNLVSNIYSKNNQQNTKFLLLNKTENDSFTKSVSSANSSISFGHNELFSLIRDAEKLSKRSRGIKNLYKSVTKELNNKYDQIAKLEEPKMQKAGQKLYKTMLDKYEKDVKDVLEIVETIPRNLEIEKGTHKITLNGKTYKYRLSTNPYRKVEEIKLLDDSGKVVRDYANVISREYETVRIQDYKTNDDVTLSHNFLSGKIALDRYYKKGTTIELRENKNTDYDKNPILIVYKVAEDSLVYKIPLDLSKLGR